jgi:hypothetical protein
MMPRRQSRPTNQALKALLDNARMSNSRLARRVNELAAHEGLSRGYNHSSVTRWIAGDTPRGPVPRLIAAALSERTGRMLRVDQIGMSVEPLPTGWDFPRGRDDAIRGAQAHWAATGDEPDSGFMPAYYPLPLNRWLATQADTFPITTNPTATITSAVGGRRCGRRDLDELRQFSDQARAWDAMYGGGDWRMNAVIHCLRERAVPLLDGSHTEPIARELFAITAELGRVIGWSAFDAGQSGIGQRHLIQALRLARASGDIEVGTYVLTTMALHSVLEGAPDLALDMVEGAFARGKHGGAAPRVLAFAKLVEARAHGRLGDETSAGSALSRAEKLLDRIRSDTPDPAWISYVTPSRLAADATEVFRDLRKPRAAIRWNEQVTGISDDHNPRAVGLRLAVVATAACHLRDLDQALATGRRALDLLGKVHSSRGSSYLRAVVEAMAPWEGDARVQEFTAQTEQPLTPKATI